MLGEGLEEGSRMCSSYSVSAQPQHKPQESLVEAAPRASLDKVWDEDRVAVTWTQERCLDKRGKD